MWFPLILGPFLCHPLKLGPIFVFPLYTWSYFCVSPLYLVLFLWFPCILGPIFVLPFVIGPYLFIMDLDGDFLEKKNWCPRTIAFYLFLSLKIRNIEFQVNNISETFLFNSESNIYSQFYANKRINLTFNFVSNFSLLQI